MDAVDADTDAARDGETTAAATGDDSEPTGRKRTRRERSTPRVDYDLRVSSILNRVETDRKLEAPRALKAKSRPAPLSKYRRRTANGRERTRMQEMNGAFDALRRAVPGDDDEEAASKQTKITTLRLAMDYIRALRGMLHGAEEGGEAGPDGASSASEGQSSPGYSGLDSEGESAHWGCTGCTAEAGRCGGGDAMVSERTWRHNARSARASLTSLTSLHGHCPWGGLNATTDRKADVYIDDVEQAMRKDINGS